MSDWQAKFETLRAQFQQRAAERLKRTAELLQTIEGSSRDEQLLRLLLKDMHWLAGVGGTYKLPELTSIGEAGEQICDKCIADGAELGPDELGALRALVVLAVAALAQPI